MPNQPRYVAVFLAISITAAAAGRAADDDWPRYGHNPALTGRSSSSGKIEAPKVSWQYSLAGRRLTLEVVPESGEHRLSLSADAAAESGKPKIPATRPRQLDLDGSGVLRPAAETYHERWAKILPNVAGFQRVAWSQTWTDQAVCRLQLFAYDQGFDHPRMVWETNPPEGTIFNPLDIVFDIDGDGVQEVCVAAHYRVMIFEGTTGRKETELRYHSSRPYGWFGLADVDADREMELVTIGDFQSHVDVLQFDRTKPEAERLSVKWRRDIEQKIEDRAKWPQVGPHPVADVTGDAGLEIVVNLYNDTGDHQWHTVVLEGTTGKVLGDLPKRYLQGTADVDADGKAELFLASTNGVLVAACGTIELVGFRGNVPKVLWSRQDACWATADLPELGTTWSTTAAQGMRHVLLSDWATSNPVFPCGAGVSPATVKVGGTPASKAGRTPAPQPPAFLVGTWDAGDSRTVTLSAMRFGTQGRMEPVWEVGGLPELTDALGLSTSEDGNQVQATVRVKLPASTTAQAVGRGARASILESHRLAADVSMPIAARLRPGEGLSVIAEAGGGQVAAIAPPHAGAKEPKTRWQRAGRGMADGSRALGPLAADLDGDGGCEVVLADQAKAGHAVLVAYRGDGGRLWLKSFDQIPGAPPVWNTGALTFWWPGHFRDPKAIDLVVDTRRGPMHSDMGELVDGRTGATIWKRDKALAPGEFSWGWGGSAFAVADFDNDQLDDMVCLYPVCFWIANGRDGKLLAARELASRKLLPAWAAYGEPMVHDFNGDRQLEVLLDSPYILALLDKSGKPLWHGLARVDFPVNTTAGNVGETTSCRHALADLDGDGQFEIASAGYGNGARAIDPKTGKVLWSLAAPTPSGPRVAAANLDGRGGDEVLYPAGNTLVAITGDRSSGRILWKWEAPAALSMPAIADTDGDGQAEIVVQDAEANIYVLDGP